MIVFDGVPPELVISVCEAALARTKPREGRELYLGGVFLRLYVTNHWAGFERFMLIGRDWAVGFNLSLPDSDTDPNNIFQMFGTDWEVSVPGVEGARAFARDMVVLKMTQSDWIDGVDDGEAP